MNHAPRHVAPLALALLVIGTASAHAQTPIPRGSWTLHFVDSQETAGGDYRAALAIDGDPATMWVTEWFWSSPPPPHELQIDLGATYDIAGFRYLPRVDGLKNGRIAAFEVLVSTDGVTWSAPVVSGTLADTSAEQQVVFAATSGRYFRLRVLSEVMGQPWAAIAELNVLASDASSALPSNPPEGGVAPGSEAPPKTGTGSPTAEVIPQSSWTLRYVDSEELAVADFRAVRAFDGNPATIWTSEWYWSSPSPPHELQIDLGGTYSIDGFRYQPRVDLANGRIADYEFFVSADGTSWGSPVASGTLGNTPFEQRVNFASRSGRYIRLRALSEVMGQPWAAIAELNVLGVPTAPSGSISQPSSPSPPPSSSGSNSLPMISLAGVFDAQAALVVLTATASDLDGAVARVDFYSGSTLLATDSSAPYSAVATGLSPGAYSFIAVAHDNAGDSTVSTAVGITVPGAQTSRRIVFTPSLDHDNLVAQYVLQIYPANPSSSAPVATWDLGKVPVVNGECGADISELVARLASGTYIATVSAVGPGGASTSDPSDSFVVP
jgi:hypothetical protein